MPAPKKTSKTSPVKAVVTPVPEASNDEAALKAAKPSNAAKAAKAPKPTKAGKAAAAPATTKADKPKKPKLVRDSFTIPKAEYGAIDELKIRAAKLGQPAKKSELLRAGIKALAGLGDEALLASLAAVPRVKTGRPAKA